MSLSSGQNKTSELTIEYTLEHVLKNLFPPPYSRDGIAQFDLDFVAFAKRERLSQDQLDFLTIIESYTKSAMAIISDYNADVLLGFDTRIDSRNDLTADDSAADIKSLLSTPVSTVKFETANFTQPMTEEEFNQIYQKLQNQSIDILKTFIMKNAACDINLPDSLRQFIASNIENSVHPEMFVAAVEHVRKTMRNGIFMRFLKNNDANFMVPIQIPKYSIHQIVAGDSPAPYSYKSFHEFLKVQKAENDLEFLQLVWKYQMDAKKFHPIGMASTTLTKSASVNSNSSISSLQRGNSNAQNSKSRLLKRSFKQGDIPPAQCPPDIPSSNFRKCIDALLVSLKYLSTEFIETNSPKQVGLPASIRKTVLGYIEKGACHPDILNPPYEHIAEALNVSQLSTFLKNKAEEKRLNAILEASIPKYTLTQLLNNEIPSPYSRDDFRRFAKQNSTEENINFLEALKEYENLSKQFYPGVIVNTEENERISITSLEKTIPAVPVPPAGMAIKTFTGHLRNMEKLIRVLKSEYIEEDAPSQVSLPASIRDSIIAFIDNGNYNPLIFESARDSVSETLQNNELNQFIRKTYHDRLNAGLTFKLASELKTNVDKLLLDELPAPYSYHSFYGFCNLQGQIQGVAFCREVMEYVKEYSQFFPDSVGSTVYPGHVAPKDLPFAEFNQKIHAMVEKFNGIFKNYLQVSSFQKIDLPESIWTPLYRNMEEKVYHPNIFTRAYDFYASALQNSLWDNYAKYLGPAKKDKYALPNYSVKQLALNEIPPPYSYLDYYAFLQTLLCEENLEFIQACYKYQEKAAGLFPDGISRPNNTVNLADCKIPPPVKRSTLTNEQFKVELTSCKSNLDTIVETFIRPDSVREVNLPVHVRKPFLQLHDSGAHHPDLINESMEHIVNMLRLNTLTKFLKSASKLDGKLTMDQSDGTEKLTIKQIVLNFVPKPYSRADFMAFLQKEHCEESLEFLVAVIEYHKYAAKFYPYGLQQEISTTSRKGSSATSASFPIVRSSSIQQHTIKKANIPLGFTVEQFEEGMSKMGEMCKDIFATYFSQDSAKEVNVDEKIRNSIATELRAENFHPEIWKPAFEIIVNLLRVNHLPKFLKRSPSMPL